MARESIAPEEFDPRGCAMTELKQNIRFGRADDGVRLAYSTMGKGPHLVRAAHCLTHLEYDLRNPLWRPWLAELSRHRTLVRYDPRGCGLSDRETGDLALDRWVADLETVVDAAGLERFALLGASQRGAIALTGTARRCDWVARPACRRRSTNSSITACCRRSGRRAASARLPGAVRGTRLR